VAEMESTSDIAAGAIHGGAHPGRYGGWRCCSGRWDQARLGRLPHPWVSSRAMIGSELVAPGWPTWPGRGRAAEPGVVVAEATEEHVGRRHHRATVGGDRGRLGPS
jgi:hypothetical protein